jgi:hypothetical protein
MLPQSHRSFLGSTEHFAFQKAVGVIGGVLLGMVKG